MNDELRFRVEQNICDEAERADKRYGPFQSSHEGYGVLAEEMLELLEAIRGNVLPHMAREAIQVAAVAMRLAEACLRDEVAFRTRSGAA